MSSKSAPPGRITLGKYIFRRISQLGVGHVFGVPGDFNLTLLDELFELEDLTWHGMCNELNAAYAADGYSRIRGLPGVLVTTYAVGELSALNGVAGAYAEHAGFIHIVGMPSRPIQNARPMIHHTMEPNMDQSTYVKMSAPVNRAQVVLTDEATMGADVDRMIEEAIKTKLPVTIYVPTDTVPLYVDKTLLQRPLRTQITNKDKVAEERLVRAVLEAIEKASCPAILADVLSIRHGAQDLTRKLVSLTQIPSFSTPLSKGVIDETTACYYGVYNGKVSFPGCCETLESSDLIINIGPLLSDSNTGGFTRNIREENLVMLSHDFCTFRGERFEGLHLLPVLDRIVQELDNRSTSYVFHRSTRKRFEVPILNNSKSGPIEQSYVWQRIGKFLKPNDIVLAEAGTAQFGIPDAVFPANISYITQAYWSSIGFTVGACVGACTAAVEMGDNRRVILLIGEGSLQMTVQDIGSLLRFGYRPVIFLVNNKGYSIERAINGPEKGYNDINTMWDYQSMLRFFGARLETGIESNSYHCETVEDFEEVLTRPGFIQAECIHLCEVVMDQFDYPWRLSTQVEIAKQKF